MGGEGEHGPGAARAHQEVENAEKKEDPISQYVTQEIVIIQRLETLVSTMAADAKDLRRDYADLSRIVGNLAYQQCLNCKGSGKTSGLFGKNDCSVCCPTGKPGWVLAPP